MAAFFNILLLILARSSCDELIQHIQFLKVENEILRAKLPERIPIMPAERAHAMYTRLVTPDQRVPIGRVAMKSRRPDTAVSALWARVHDGETSRRKLYNVVTNSTDAPLPNRPVNHWRPCVARV